MAKSPLHDNHDEPEVKREETQDVKREEPLFTAPGDGGLRSDFFVPHGLEPGHDSRDEPPLHGDVVVAGVGAQMSASQTFVMRSLNAEARESWPAHLLHSPPGWQRAHRLDLQGTCQQVSCINAE